jgi:hypothetical protein
MNGDGDFDAQMTKDFRIKEFEALRKEIDERRKDQWATERDVVLSTIVIFWALGNATIPTPLVKAVNILWLSPLIIWMAGFSRWVDDLSAVKQIGNFIMRREIILDPKNHGWEHYIAKVSKGRITWIFRMLSWLLILAIDIGAPLFVWRNV